MLVRIVTAALWTLLEHGGNGPLYPVGWVVGRMHAKKLLLNMVRIYCTPPYLIPADPLAFRAVDHGWYRQRADEFRAEGYTDLHVHRNLTMEANWDPRGELMMWVMDHPEEGASAFFMICGITKVNAQGQKYRTIHRSLEIETAFSDDTWIGTSVNNEASQLRPFPMVHMQWVSPETTPARLAELHRERVRRHLEADPERRVVFAPGFDGLIARTLHQTGVKAAYRRSLGWITDDEFDRLGGSSLPTFIRQPILKQLREQRSAAEQQVNRELRERGLAPIIPLD